MLCGDFKAALKQMNTGDLIYCDPPYIPLGTTASFIKYNQDGFDEQDQRRLADMVKEVSQTARGVLILNHDTELARELYQDAHLEILTVQRNIATKSSSSQRIGELLAIYD